MYLPNAQQVLSGALAITGGLTGLGKDCKFYVSLVE
jgi:hypothetical protein